MTPTTYGRDFAYCLKSHGGVRGFNASLWRFLLRCTLFCHSVATFLTSVSSYEGGCGFEDYILCTTLQRMTRILVFMPNFCHFMLSKSKRVSNGLRSVDKEQVFFYPHLIAYFLYKQRKNFCFPQQIVSNLTLSVYRESMAKLEESWLTVNWYIDSLFL